MLYKEFYSELGKLLYAIADINGVISKKEKKLLHDIVRKELVPAEKHKDEFGTDAAFYAEMEFEYLDEEIADTESAFESFIYFVEEHRTAFDEKLKNTSLRVANELAAVYHGTNRKEQVLIQKLKHKLEKIEIVNAKHHHH